MIDLNEIHSLTDFQRNTREHLERLKKSGKPEVLTVRGRAKVVVQDAEAYQRILDLAENAAAILGIHRGLLGMYAGTGQPAEEVLGSLEQELGIASEAI